jgi:hypothetical protein
MKERHITMLVIALIGSAVIVAGNKNGWKRPEPEPIYVTNTVVSYVTNTEVHYIATTAFRTSTYSAAPTIMTSNDIQTLHDIAPELDEQFWNSLTQEQRLNTN